MQMTISLRGAVADSSTFRLSWSSTTSSSSSLHLAQNFRSSSSSSLILPLSTSKLATSSRNRIICSAVQESSTSTTATAETKEEEEVNAAPKAAPTKKPPAKAPVKSLPQMMEEDVIPSLKAILEAQQDISDIELVFQDNKLERSFLKQGNPYSFWAFSPNGVLAGPKGFSLSSYNSQASTVEPFLIDEKKLQQNLSSSGLRNVWLHKGLFLCGEINLLNMRLLSKVQSYN